MPVRIHPDPLPWPDKERRPGKHAGVPGESVFAEKAADGPPAGAVRPLYSKRAMKR